MLGRVTRSIDDAILKAFESQGFTHKEIANNFAKGFNAAVKSIIPNCTNKLLNTNSYLNPVNCSILFQKASGDKISKIVKNLNSNKAPGADGIKVSHIKMCGKEISVAIANLINTSIKSGVYPDKLKRGCVRPIFKKGKRNEFSNYRPITLLSSIDKVVEKYICEQIHIFYQKTKVIYDNQYGFQKGKGTTNLLTKFTDEVNAYLNKKKHVLALFIDFSRAFDTLNHTQLQNKLDTCGVRGPLLAWCADYLRNRSYVVNVRNTNSDTIIAEEGTAQGSVLGPLHFLSYVNDMSKCLEYCSCYQFADDTCIMLSDRDPNKICDYLQSDFNMLAMWCHDAGLVLNAEKTKLIHIRSPYLKFTPIKDITAHSHRCLHTGRSSSCSCPSIELVDNYTYLGITIDYKFNWSLHIDHVCKKLRQFLANMIIINARIPFKVKLLLYNCFAHTYIQYGLSSYGRTYSTYLNNIYKLQLKILKTIVSNTVKQKFEKNELGLFKHCKTLPVQEQFKYTILKEEFFNDNLRRKIEHPISTRAITAGKLLSKPASNTYGERTTGYIVPRLINQLPAALSAAVTRNNIKQKLKGHFLDNL